MASSPSSLKTGPDEDGAALLSRALAHHQAGERPQAERLYRQVLDQGPPDAEALYLYALFVSEEARDDLAEPMLRAALLLNPQLVGAHVALANLDYGRGRLAQAIGGYRRALEIQPSHPIARGNLVAALAESAALDPFDLTNAEGLEAAIVVCRAAVALLDDPAPAQAVLGRMLLAAGRFDEAIAVLSAAADGLAQASVWTALSQARLGGAEPRAALAAADHALGLDAESSEAWAARGGALIALQDHRAAIAAFQNAVALAPDQVRLHIALGAAWADIDQPARSLPHLKRALALDPLATAAHAHLGAVLYRCGDLDAAERHCRLALAADPGLASVHRNLAGVLADRGRAGEARRHRDIAYGLCNLIIEPAPDPLARILVLTTADSGNTPHRYLLPPDRYTRIDWFIEYARPGQAAELPAHDLVFNIIGDPDYAAPTAAPVAAFLADCGCAVLNPPARIEPTRRDRLPSLLAGIEGLKVPRTARIAPGDLPAGGLAEAARAAGFSGPLLVRPIGSHGGHGLELVRAATDLGRIPIGEAGAYVTEFMDFRSPADGLYRKYRVIFVDRVAYPYHLAISDNWLVHYVSSGMIGSPERQAEEMRFLQDPETALGGEAMAAIGAIGRRLDLDYAGLDFSLSPDGRVLVFEANATMLVHPEGPGELARKNPYVTRITDAFQALVEARGR